MTKIELSAKIAAELNLHQKQVKQAVQLVLDGIVDIIANEGRMELRKFGVFDVRTHNPRMARNPRTGEEIIVPERKSVTFKPGMEMERRVISGSPVSSAEA